MTQISGTWPSQDIIALSYVVFPSIHVVLCYAPLMQSHCFIRCHIIRFVLGTLHVPQFLRAVACDPKINFEATSYLNNL